MSADVNLSLATLADFTARPAVLTTAAEFAEWGRRLALTGVKLTGHESASHSLYAAAIQGYRFGLQEIAERQMLDAAPTDAEIAGSDDDEELPDYPEEDTPESLARDLHRIAERYDAMTGRTPAFLAWALRDLASDVEYFRAADHLEFDARRNEMMRTLQDCPTCQQQAWLDKQ